MLDTITYQINNLAFYGALTKTVTGVVLDVALEISALQGQLAAFRAGRQTPDIIALEADYELQIEFLQSFLTEGSS